MSEPMQFDGTCGTCCFCRWDRYTEYEYCSPRGFNSTHTRPELCVSRLDHCHCPTERAAALHAQLGEGIVALPGALAWHWEQICFHYNCLGTKCAHKDACEKARAQIEGSES